MKILVVDIGGTNVKMLASGQREPRKFPSGPGMTPRQMAAGVKQARPGVEVRCGIDRLPGAGAPWPARLGAPQSRQGMGRVQLSTPPSGGP